MNEVVVFKSKLKLEPRERARLHWRFVGTQGRRHSLGATRGLWRRFTAQAI
jgi:hypothetical protein